MFGVSVTTKYGTAFLACQGTVTGVRYQPPAFGNTPTQDAQIYTDSSLQTTWTPASGEGIYLFQFGNAKYAVYVGPSGIIGSVTSCNSTNPILTNQGYSTCSGTTLYTVFRDTNNLSGTYLDYYVNNVNVGASAPAPGSSTANFVNRDINSFYVCVGVNKYYQQIDINPCSATYNQTQTGALYEENSTDCGYVPPSPSVTPTPSPTPIPPLTTYTGCGRGNTVEAACSDAVNARTFYSNCGPFEFTTGCYVYLNTSADPLIAFDYVFIPDAFEGSLWNINNSTGQITGLSDPQCDSGGGGGGEEVPG
jgi:hypothetical protein